MATNAALNGLMREFLGWISERPRTYAETMEVWRTTCPRHSVWEDALADGLIQLDSTSNQAAVTLTERGKERLGRKV
jgi:hypothetical protein